MCSFASVLVSPFSHKCLFFFFKDLFFFYYFFIGKSDIQRGETERKIFRPMIHSPSERNRPILCRSEARSLFRVSHAGAGSQSFGLNHLRHHAGPNSVNDFKSPFRGPGAVAQVVNRPRLARPGSHMGAGSNPGSPASLPAPCLWPGKAVKDGPGPWDPAPCGRPGRGSWLRIGITSARCAHLGSESSDGRSFSLSLLSLYICLSNEKIIKINL